jgi:hypothetical protein
MDNLMNLICSGRIYAVTVEQHSFEVRAIRASVVNGWWLCEGLTTGERVMLPECVLKEGDAEQHGDGND